MSYEYSTQEEYETDRKAVFEAWNWCLYKAKNTGSAKRLAALLLSGCVDMNNKISLSESFLGLDGERVELAMAIVRWVANGEEPKSAVCDGEKMLKELAKTYPDKW